MLLVFFLLAGSAIASTENSECRDEMARCSTLDQKYCKAPYDRIAKDLCANTCGLCDMAGPVKRAHGHHHDNEPNWYTLNCWENGHNHIKDPFCALYLTTTTIPTTTTTMTTTTTVATTTQRICTYVLYNNTNIDATDFGSDREKLTGNITVPLNDSVRIIGDIDFCEQACISSFLNEGYECWAFTYNPTDRCTIYYYSRPLYAIEAQLIGNSTDDLLYLKRCDDDPTTPVPTTTQSTTPTTPRMCDYTVFNDTKIGATDFGILAVTAVVDQNSNITVHVSRELDFCLTTCVNSILTNGNECWAFTFSDVDQCYLYYSRVPLYIKHPELIGNTTGTTLYFKECTDDGRTTPGVSLPAPFGNQNPGGAVISVDSQTFTQLGLRQGENATDCVFSNMSYALGEKWKDGCQYECECVDVTQNMARCMDLCPHYTSIPNGCELKKAAGDCCPQLECANTTVVTPVVGDCNNTIDTCDFYPDTACQGLYEPWARAHCALRCGYCLNMTAPCYDKISYCDRYEPNTCVDYEGWGRSNCKLFCGYCTNN